MERNRDVVVIGASAGGVQAISQLTRELPADLAASVMIVVHISPRPAPRFHVTLCGKGKLPCTPARNGERVERGQIFVAPPDRHLRVANGDGDLRLQVDRGPRESRSRPSIDALFRSAAGSCGARTIGVLLTGYLDDGVVGLGAIQRAGGLALVQDPQDAEVAELPQRALEALVPDQVLPLRDMADAIGALVNERLEAEPSVVPADVRTEAALAARAADLWPELEKLGHRSGFGCPHCGGPLWMLQPGKADEHYRCHVGHAFSPLSLLDEQDLEVERALYSAIRVVEEKARFLMRLAASSDNPATSARYLEDAKQAELEADTLRNFVLGQKRKS